MTSTVGTAAEAQKKAAAREETYAKIAELHDEHRAELEQERERLERQLFSPPPLAAMATVGDRIALGRDLKKALGIWP